VKVTKTLVWALVPPTLLLGSLAADAEALPTADDAVAPHAAEIFATARVRIARRVQHRHDEWIEAKRDRRRRIRERREAAEAVEAAAAPTAAPTVAGSFGDLCAGGALSAEQVAGYAAGAGFPSWTLPTMVGFADRESGCNPTAINATSGACGLWQIYPAQPGCTDPAANAAMAFDKFTDDGYGPWGG